MEDMRKYLDKAKFLSKFSCFDGYMQYVDSKWSEQCQGISFAEFESSLRREVEASNRTSMRSEFYNNYLQEEMLVRTTDCGGCTK